MPAPPGNSCSFETIDSTHPQPQSIQRAPGLFRRLTVYRQLALSVALILALGALVGTLVTRYLVLRSVALGWVLLATALGVAGSILAASWVARWALRPLSDLQALVRQAQQAHTGIDTYQLASHDPQIQSLARDVNALVDELRQRNHQMQALSKHAINAQEDERLRIARSLHDDTGQSLAMLIISLERLEEQLQGLDEATQAQLAAAHQLATHTLASLRQIVHGLRPAILDDLGLVPAIRWYATSNLQAAGIRLTFQADDLPRQLPARLNITLFRIAQEAVNNIIRHAEAHSAAIRLTFTDGEIQMLIEDDGQGFRLDLQGTQFQQDGHWGLAGIRERVLLVNGQVNIFSEQGSGTRIQVVVPIDREGEAQDA